MAEIEFTTKELEHEIWKPIPCFIGEPHLICNKCKLSKPVAEFHKCIATARGYQYTCRACKTMISAEYRKTHDTGRHYRENRQRVIARSRAWREANPEKAKANRQRYYRTTTAELKARAYAILGDKCSRCSITDVRCLQIDHVNGGGTAAKRERGNRSTVPIYQQIVAGDSKGYQLLCANCNWIKRVENREHTTYPTP